jgi:hypothetical protein
LGEWSRSLDEQPVNTHKGKSIETGVPMARPCMNAKTRVRKSRFVMACLVFHAVVTLVCFPGLGHQGVGTLLGTFYMIYFVYTSIPAFFGGALLPENVRTGELFSSLLLANGVIVVWLTANWMHYVFVGPADSTSEPSDARACRK